MAIRSPTTHPTEDDGTTAPQPQNCTPNQGVAGEEVEPVPESRDMPPIANGQGSGLQNLQQGNGFGGIGPRAQAMPTGESMVSRKERAKRSVKPEAESPPTASGSEKRVRLSGRTCERPQCRNCLLQLDNWQGGRCPRCCGRVY